MAIADIAFHPDPAQQWARSSASHEFEALWRDLRSDTLVPSRDAFHPSRAARFLHNLVVTNALANDGNLTIRLAGDRMAQLAGRNLAGANYLDFLPEQYHDGAMQTGQVMTNHPCGLWQITPVHLAWGYIVHLEVTVFPLGANAHTGPCLLAHARRVDNAILPSSTGAFAFDTASTFRFLDVGAGEPNWPLAA